MKPPKKKSRVLVEFGPGPNSSLLGRGLKEGETAFMVERSPEDALNARDDFLRKARRWLPEIPEEELRKRVQFIESSRLPKSPFADEVLAHGILSDRFKKSSLSQSLLHNAV